MIHLDIERINEYAPYKVEAEAGQYIFETDHGILYGVSFDEETMPHSHLTQTTATVHCPTRAGKAADAAAGIRRNGQLTPLVKNLYDLHCASCAAAV